MRKLFIGMVAVLLLTIGCGREITVEEVGAVQVPGSGSIYRFCDGPTLIYFVDVDASTDEIEAIWPDMCYPEDGEWVYSTDTADYDPNGSRVNGNVDDGE